MKNLSTQKIIQGINVCFENSKSLLEDSQILFNKKRYCRSFTLSQFAIEEIGKSLLLFNTLLSILLGSRDKIDFDELKRKFKNHIDKSLNTVLMDFRDYAYANPKRDDFNLFIEETKKEINDSRRKYDDLKNQSLYVNFKNSIFYKPEDVITEEMAKTHINKAEKRYKSCYDYISNFLSIMVSANIKDENSFIEFTKLIK